MFIVSFCGNYKVFFNHNAKEFENVLLLLIRIIYEYVRKTLSFAVELNTVVTYVGIGAASGLALGILVCIIIERLCRRRNQPKGENRTRDIKRKHGHVTCILSI